MGSRRRVSPSMVVATISLIVAMAGTGVAAVLVTSSQIKDNTIQSQDIRDGTLRSVDYKDGSVTANDLSSSVRASIGHELVYAQESGSLIPATLANQFSLSSNSNLPVTITRSGRLWISAHANLDIGCSVSGTAWLYLMVDGVPLRTSVMRIAVDNGSSSGGFDSDRTFTGVTEKRYNPGTYTIAIGAQCASGAASAAGWSSSGRNQTVVVLR